MTSYSKSSTSSSYNTASGTLRPPRPTSGYQKCFEAHRAHSSQTIDYESIGTGSGQPSPSISSRTSFSSYASTPSDENPHKRHRAPSSNIGLVPAVPTNFLPDLGEVDLSDGRNMERPQRFKATIHFNCKKADDGEDDDGHKGYSRRIGNL